MDSLAKFLEVSPMWIKSYVPTSYSVLYVLYIIVQMYIRFEYNKNLLYFLWSFQILFFTIKWEELYAIQYTFCPPPVHLYLYDDCDDYPQYESHGRSESPSPLLYIWEFLLYTVRKNSRGRVVVKIALLINIIIYVSYSITII